MSNQSTFEQHKAFVRELRSPLLNPRKKGSFGDVFDGDSGSEHDSLDDLSRELEKKFNELFGTSD